MFYLSLFLYLYYQTVFPIDFTQSFCMPGENNAAKINIWYLTAIFYSFYLINMKWILQSQMFSFKVINWIEEWIYFFCSLSKFVPKLSMDVYWLTSSKNFCSRVANLIFFIIFFSHKVFKGGQTKMFSIPPILKNAKITVHKLLT